MISPSATVAASAVENVRQGEVVVHGFVSSPVTETAERLFRANAAGAKPTAMTAMSFLNIVCSLLQRLGNECRSSDVGGVIEDDAIVVEGVCRPVVCHAVGQVE